MGKLNIAHHKSYHPYRRDNIERVRKDEELARLQELKDEGRLMLADSEARIDLLKRRKPEYVDIKGHEIEMNTLSINAGHVNLFASEEHQNTASTSAAQLSSKIQEKESERGIALAPNTKDLQPWYNRSSSSSTNQQQEDSGSSLERHKANRKKQFDATRKATDDPLTKIHMKIGRHARSLTVQDNSERRKNAGGSVFEDPTLSRLSREAGERSRADALLERKRREGLGISREATTEDSSSRVRGYGNLFNRSETEDAALRRRDPGNSKRKETRFFKYGKANYASTTELDR